MAEVDDAFYQTDYRNQVKPVFKDGWNAAIKFMESCQASTNTQRAKCRHYTKGARCIYPSNNGICVERCDSL